ncbi:putative membrane protein [Acinetobacter baumannii 299505]|nr:putative membrane protein [Acinetobacter baumannii 299505]
MHKTHLTLTNQKHFYINGFIFKTLFLICFIFKTIQFNHINKV